MFPGELEIIYYFHFIYQRRIRSLISSQIPIHIISSWQKIIVYLCIYIFTITLGLQQSSRYLECGLHPWGDDQQQANVPRQTLPGPDLQDPGGPGQPQQGGSRLHHQPQGPAVRQQSAPQAHGGLAEGLSKRRRKVGDHKPIKNIFL